MIWYLNKRTVLSVPSAKSLHFGGYLKSGEFYSALIFGLGTSSLTLLLIPCSYNGSHSLL